MNLRNPLLRSAVAAALLALTLAASADPLPPGIELGMKVSQLREAVPGLFRVARPARLAGGLVGRFSAPDITIAGESLAPTFYFAGEELRRVEYVDVPTMPERSYDTLLAWGRAQWGQELAASSPEATYATWTRDGMNIYLQRTLPPMQPSVRLVIKRSVEKDASEL